MPNLARIESQRAVGAGHAWFAQTATVLSIAWSAARLSFRYGKLQ